MGLKGWKGQKKRKAVSWHLRPKINISMHHLVIFWEGTRHCRHCCGCAALEFSLLTLVLFVDGIWKKEACEVRRGLSDAAANAMWESLWPGVRELYMLQHWRGTACLLAGPGFRKKTCLKVSISLPSTQLPS